MSVRSSRQIISPPKQKRGWRTRRRLVRAAMRLFSEKGYEATTTNQISKRAGVGHLPGNLSGLFRTGWREVHCGIEFKDMAKDGYAGCHPVPYSNIFRNPQSRSRPPACFCPDRAKGPGIPGGIGEISVSDTAIATFLIDETVEACVHRSVFFDTPFDEQKLAEELANMVSRYLVPSDD